MSSTVLYNFLIYEFCWSLWRAEIIWSKTGRTQFYSAAHCAGKYFYCNKSRLTQYNRVPEAEWAQKESRLTQHNRVPEVQRAQKKYRLNQNNRKPEVQWAQNKYRLNQNNSKPEVERAQNKSRLTQRQPSTWSGMSAKDVSTHPLSRLVVQRAGHVDGASHVLDCEGSSYVPARDLISNTGGCKEANKQTLIINFTSSRRKSITVLYPKLK
jgi:hypothetical protein